MGSWDRLSSSYTSAFIVWLFGIIPWFNSQPQIMQLINQKHLETFLLFHVPPLLLFQTQLLALFSLPPVIPRVVPCPPGSPISSGHSAGHRFGPGDVTVTCRAVCCRASQPCQPTTYLPVAGRESPPAAPSPSCLIYTEPALRERSSETISEFRGLVGN